MISKNQYNKLNFYRSVIQFVIAQFKEGNLSSEPIVQYQAKILKKRS
jgi:hypothetical protein